MSDTVPVHGVVVGHGEMPQGLVDAVRHIAGDAADGLVAVSNEGKSPDALIEELDRLAGADLTIVFADLRSGSCGLAAAYSCRDRERRAVICGVNLPMLLDFVFHRGLPLQELVERLVDKGRDAIRVVPLSRSET